MNQTTSNPHCPSSQACTSNVPGVSSPLSHQAAGHVEEQHCLKRMGSNCILTPLFFPAQENKRMKQCLEEELKSRKDLEKLVRRLLKQTDECGREDTGRKSSLIA